MVNIGSKILVAPCIICVLFVSPINWSNWVSIEGSISGIVYLILGFYYESKKSNLRNWDAWWLGMRFILLIGYAPEAIFSESMAHPTYLSMTVTILLIIISGIVIYLSKDDSINISIPHSLLFCPLWPFSAYISASWAAVGIVLCACSAVGVVVNLLDGKNMAYNLFWLLVGVILTFEMLAIKFVKRPARPKKKQ